MCIRDRVKTGTIQAQKKGLHIVKDGKTLWLIWNLTDSVTCLLYTSDAADDLLCVDLGGRRIIKKQHI